MIDEKFHKIQAFIFFKTKANEIIYAFLHVNEVRLNWNDVISFALPKNEKQTSKCVFINNNNNQHR